MEAGDGRQLVFAGCSPDFAARRLHKLFARGLRLEIADIREGCSWVHGEDAALVTDKAARIVESSVTYPDAAADAMSYADRQDTVVVIGGGVAGTQAAAELAKMGHPVELIERRPFLGGRAARIGTVFPTNDCGQCLPSGDAQAGTRKCFHRNLAIDHPNLSIRRRATVESVSGHPGAFEVGIRRLPNIVTEACINCGTCETVCPEDASEPGHKAIFTEYYDGRVIRTIDLDTCSFCGKCAEECPVEAIDFDQSPERTTVHAGAILTAVGCEPAPPQFYSEFHPEHDNVVTQVEFAKMLDDWEALATLGRMPVEELVMIQCAGSRDKRHLPHCSRLCCMIALKHAIRLRTLFPEMKVTICYLEMRTAGVGYENWFLAAREAGVEFLRGTPPEVQFDSDGDPVIELEDVTAARKRVLRPDLVVLSTGMVPAAATERLAQTLGIDRDDRFVGFDGLGLVRRDPRPQEPRHRDEQRGSLRLWFGRGPQGAHRGEHRGRRRRRPDPLVPDVDGPPGHSPVAGRRRPVRGLRHLRDHVPLRRHHAGGPAGGRSAAGRSQRRRQARGDRPTELPRLRHLRRQLPRDGDRPQPQ